MRYTILICLFFYALFVYSQGNNRIRIYRTGEELKTPIKDTFFAVSIRHAVFDTILIVTQNDSTKLRLGPKNIWGFKDKDGKIYRNHRLKFICLEGEAEGFCLYSKSVGIKANYILADVRNAGGVGTFGSSGQNYSHVREVYYFSRSVDSKIFDFTKFQIKKQYGDKSSFPNRLAQIKRGILQTYSSIVSSITPRKMIEIYNNCK